MGLWLLFAILLIGIFMFLLCLFRQKEKKYEQLIKSQKIQICAINSELQEKNSELQEKNSELQEKNKTYKTEINQLKKEKDSLEAHYLKKVTAADVKKNNLARYRRKMKSLRKKTIAEEAEEIVGKGPSWLPHAREGPKSHQMGKPKGSKGGGRKRPEKIHAEKELHAHRCYHCGTDLGGVKEYFVYDRVVTDLFRYMEDEKDYLTLRLKNVKLIVYRKKCPNCKKWVYPEQGLLKNARIGLSLVSFVISRRIRTGLPYEVIIDELSTHFGSNFSITTPAIIEWFKDFSEVIEGLYAQLEELVKTSKVLHVDETGLPMNGENWWLWVVCCANFVLYVQSASRGHESVKHILDGFEGTLISDFFSAYNKFKDVEQQKCLGHLLSDIIELIVKLEKENERIEKKLQNHEEAVQKEETSEATPKSRGRPKNLEPLTAPQVKTLKTRRIQNLKSLNQAIRLRAFFRATFKHTLLGWKTDKSKRLTKEEAEEKLRELVFKLREEGLVEGDLEKLLKRCNKYEKMLFSYLKYEGMPPDNNRAERDLRPFVVQRKRSGGFKSPEVMRHYVIYLSLYMTCKLNGKDFDKLLDLVFSGEKFNLGSFLSC
ncbi:MAG: transposase [Candidatus Lokiarchaeota archaeon]|nr:transposase [Candidatus Lokiarchaeota archaeon]MBD3338061.1 transposase [Candidatus Lokiarchaeota archaeon]